MLKLLKSLLVVSVLTVLMLTGGCRQRQDDAPPVATPTVTLSRDRAALGSPLSVTYRFDVAPDAKIEGDYWVFMHVLDLDNEWLWGDDHQPPVPTSEWTPGQTIEYTRTIFVPNYPYIGTAQLRLGLYMPSTGNRLPLAAKDLTRREYEVGRLELLPQSENVFLIYKDGWHPAEVSPDNPTTEWQWTRKAATISFRNPKRDSTFYIQYDARVDLFTPPQQVTVRIGDQVVGSFAADSPALELITMPITADQLGDADITELTIEVDRTFLPGGTDTRELGIRIFHAFIEPK